MTAMRTNDVTTRTRDDITRINTMTVDMNDIEGTTDVIDTTSMRRRIDTDQSRVIATAERDVHPRAVPSHPS